MVPSTLLPPAGCWPICWKPGSLARPAWLRAEEAKDDRQDYRAAPPEAGLRVCAPVHHCAGAPSPGEHRSANTRCASGRRQLGWNPSAIRILDRDLGRSGAQAAGREDFKTLVAEVSMGQVGAVFALEVSRLARSNLDWHRLLELCAFTGTLGDRRGWLLRPGRLQRRAAAGAQRHHGAGRAAFPARAPPGRQAQQG